VESVILLMFPFLNENVFLLFPFMTKCFISIYINFALKSFFFLKLLFFYSFIHVYIRCLGHFSPLPASPSLSPIPPSGPFWIPLFRIKCFFSVYKYRYCFLIYII
jgi:hypothetical protein